MKTIFKKMFAGVMSATLVASLVVGLNISNKTVKAEDTEVTLKPWVFYQAGNMASAAGLGVYNSVSTAEETFASSYFPETQGERSVASTKISDSFTTNIKTNGWDALWDTDPDTINPWMLAVRMNALEIKAGHDYTITFTASATTGKYAYFALGSEYEGEPKLYDQDPLLILDTTPKEYTFTFTNWAGSEKLDLQLMLGAFNGELDYAGTDISSKLVYGKEANWTGEVKVSEFKIVDHGQNPEYVTEPPIPTEKPTVKPTVKPTTPTVKPTVKPTVGDKTKKLAKVKRIKAKNNKKGTVKITWRKVAKAKSYQVKVGKKTYKVKKTKLTVKKLRKGKRYTIKIRAKAAGYKTSAWATKKVKIKK